PALAVAVAIAVTGRFGLGQVGDAVDGRSRGEPVRSAPRAALAAGRRRPDGSGWARSVTRLTDEDRPAFDHGKDVGQRLRRPHGDKDGVGGALALQGHHGTVTQRTRLLPYLYDTTSGREVPSEQRFAPHGRHNRRMSSGRAGANATAG